MLTVDHQMNAGRLNASFQKGDDDDDDDLGLRARQLRRSICGHVFRKD